MVSDAQKRATAAYRKKHVKQLCMKFYPGEEDVYEFVKSQPKVNAYLKELVRKDMEGKTGKQEQQA